VETCSIRGVLFMALSFQELQAQLQPGWCRRLR